MKLPSYQQLSKEQDKINNLPLDGSYLVVGPPGTGKTVMALYRSKMLVTRRRQPTLLMHSRLLTQYTGTAAGELGIDGRVGSFHQWFYGFYRAHFRRRPPQIEPWHYDWQVIMREFTTNPPPKQSLPHLLVDEGQDINKHFYPLARHLAAHLTVFADENQRLTEQNATVADIRAYGAFTSVHELRRNYRNTKEIAALAAHFYSGLPSGIPDPPARSGELPVLIRYANLNATVQAIATYERNHPDRQVGVFVPTKRLRDKLANRLQVAGRTVNQVQVYQRDENGPSEVDFTRPGIFLMCYPNAKGLEFDTVYIPELQSYRGRLDSPEFKMLFYVLISRARDNLFLAYSGEEIPAIVGQIPKALVETR
jgi:superfamily I DNA/RNA helicase